VSGPIPVFTDYNKVEENLTDKRFMITQHFREAKILWLTSEDNQHDYYKAETDQAKTYINWFQKEQAYVIKNNLANLIYTSLKDKTGIMETYDLNNQLPVFIGAFLERQKLGEENTWIIKPNAMARSIDTWVTNNLEQIVRLVETGAKIAQKYIDRPITFQGRKIDLRYVVLLKSLLPLQLYVPEEFYIRFSNNQFTMAETTF